MDLLQEAYQILAEMGPGQITASVYDTAWVARLAEWGEPIGKRALEWIRACQLSDGSWGTPEILYHHERLVCTLAAMTTLARRKDPKDAGRLRRAQLALEVHAQGLKADPAGETIGFELIVPALMAEAASLDLIQPKNGLLDHLVRQREVKLAALPAGMINRYVTVAFSAEMVGSEARRLIDLENLQEANGSVAYSSAATAWFITQIRQDPAALQYLQTVAVDGGQALPYTAPIDTFEIAWSLWNLALTDLIDDEKARCLYQPQLDFLEANWRPGQGIAAVAPLTLVDGDTTAMAYDVLSRFGRAVDLETVLGYEEADRFRCFGLEANPSISTNVHVLNALRTAGFDRDHPSVQKVRRFLRRAQTLELFWMDKWHASPYYTTAHAIIASAGYDNDLVERAVQWILDTQNADGSWGYYLPTAEETAYCLQALCIWQRSGKQVSSEVLRRGAAWLDGRTEPPYTLLWIGKSLYAPILVIRSAILSALRLVTEEISFDGYRDGYELSSAEVYYEQQVLVS
jgi:halimadienyl-diphosphate synthase